MNFTAADIESILRTIEGEVKSYPTPTALLAKLSDDSEYGNGVKKNLTGWYGYYCQALSLMVRYFKPKNILELGNQLGVSTMMMYYEMAPDARMVTIDILKDQRFVPDEALNDTRVRFCIGDALDLRTYGDKIPIDIDFLFTDTIHFYKQLKDEYSIYRHLLANRAIIVIDDIYLNDKGKLFDELPLRKWDISKFAHPSGFGVALYERPRTERADPAHRVTMAALASADIWHREARCLEDCRLRVNIPGIKNDIKARLQRYPRINKVVREHIVPAARSIMKGFMGVKKG